MSEEEIKGKELRIWLAKAYQVGFRVAELMERVGGGMPVEEALGEVNKAVDREALEGWAYRGRK